MTRQTPFLTEPQWHQEQSCRLWPLWLQGPSCLPFSFSWRSFTMSRPLQPGVGLLRRLCHPSHTLALSRPRARQSGIGLPKFRDARRIEVPLGACCRPGAHWNNVPHSMSTVPSTTPFGSGVSATFTYLASRSFTTQISRVTIGTRSGRSTVLWLKVAELLSLGFTPSRVPLVNACQLDLTPLFMCSSLREQSIRHVKWRGMAKARGITQDLVSSTGIWVPSQAPSPSVGNTRCLLAPLRPALSGRRGVTHPAVRFCAAPAAPSAAHLETVVAP